MKVTDQTTHWVNANYRNYLFVQLTTDNGLTGIGEASLEWQERAVESILQDWVAERIVGTDPRDVVATSDALIRDQYQGGSTVMTAISAAEIALWDVVGKDAGQPVYELIGGRQHERLPAYANGWYGGNNEPAAFAERAVGVVERGYAGLKVDPFGAAWQTMTADEIDYAVAIVSAIREAVGHHVDIMIEVHGRLNADTAINVARQLEPLQPAWYEEPVVPNDFGGLKKIRDAIEFPVATGERLYAYQEFERLIGDGCVDVVQMDPSHCGGLTMSRRIAKLAAAATRGTSPAATPTPRSEAAPPGGLSVSPHCSIGPVALAAALHFDWATPNVAVQENFADFDVAWRDDIVRGWNPCDNGYFELPDSPGLGVSLDESVCESHPYQKHLFPSLWDASWVTGFTQAEADE